MQKIIGFHNKNENIDIMQRNVCTGQAADLKCSGTRFSAWFRLSEAKSIDLLPLVPFRVTGVLLCAALL